MITPPVPVRIVILVLLLGLGCSGQKKGTSIEKIAIHHFPWNTLFFASQSCDDVMNSEDSVVIVEPDEIREFTSIYESLSLVEFPDYDSIDARLCVVLYGPADSVIQHISFSGTSLMQIGDKVYRTDESLFRFLLGHLPVDYLET